MAFNGWLERLKKKNSKTIKVKIPSQDDPEVITRAFEYLERQRSEIPHPKDTVDHNIMAQALADGFYMGVTYAKKRPNTPLESIQPTVEMAVSQYMQTKHKDLGDHIDGVVIKVSVARGFKDGLRDERSKHAEESH